MNHIFNPLTFFLSRISETGLVDENVSVVSTLVIEQGRPSIWYDTVAIGAGEIKPRPRRDIVSKTIQKSWAGRLSENIVFPFAVLVKYVSTAPNSEHVIEHITNRSIDELFSRTDTTLKGIIIPFITPPTNHNSLIRVNWSRHYFSAERKMNKLPLNATPVGGPALPFPANTPGYSKHGNLATYEGSETLCVEAPINATLLKSLKKFCDTLGGIIRGQKVVQFTAFFKVGPNDSIWFLWSSSVKLSKIDDVPLGVPVHSKSDELGEIRKRIALQKRIRERTTSHNRHKGPGPVLAFIDQIPSLVRSGTPELNVPTWMPEHKYTSTCLVCSAHLPIVSLYYLPFSAIYDKHEELVRWDNERTDQILDRIYGGEVKAASEFTESPPPFPIFMKKIFPMLNVQRWVELRSNKGFLESKGKVCYACARSYVTVPEKVILDMKPSTAGSARGGDDDLHRRVERVQSALREYLNRAQPTPRAPLGPVVSKRSGSREMTPRSGRLARVLLPTGTHEFFETHCQRGCGRCCKHRHEVDESDPFPLPPRHDPDTDSFESLATYSDSFSFKLNPIIFRGASALTQYEYQPPPPLPAPAPPLTDRPSSKEFFDAESLGDENGESGDAALRPSTAPHPPTQQKPIHQLGRSGSRRFRIPKISTAPPEEKTITKSIPGTPSSSPTHPPKTKEDDALSELLTPCQLHFKATRARLLNLWLEANGGDLVTLQFEDNPKSSELESMSMEGHLSPNSPRTRNISMCHA